MLILIPRHNFTKILNNLTVKLNMLKKVIKLIIIINNSFNVQFKT